MIEDTLFFIKSLLLKIINCLIYFSHNGETYFSNVSKNHSSDDMWLQKEDVMLLK